MNDVKAIPDGYHSLQPYLIFKECAGALAFYSEAFGATERFRMNQPDGRIGHAEIQIGDSVIMMADEVPAKDIWSPEHYGGCPISLQIYTEDCDAMHAKAVSLGATSIQEPEDRPYGDRSSGIKDRFGYTWYISTHIKDVDFQAIAAS
jgi:PhnB protein